MSWLLSLSSFTKVMLGLLLGIFAGLFFGELAGSLEIFGEAYIRLLQMTVLPYILVSLVGGLGRLDASIAQRIGITGGILILIIWGVTMISNLFLSLSYPDWTMASQFSTSMVEQAKPFDPLTLYVPSNPFYSMANSVVPAVVVFSILLGLALISVKEKTSLLDSLNTLSEALMRIASFVGKLAPIGIFAISAAAAGTLRVEELSRLQVYLWAYLGAWTVITFWTLPAIVAWSTPLSYRQVLRESRVPMVTAFATGTVLVVLPMIAERCKRLLAENGCENEDTDSVIDVMVPTAYSFPSAGTLLGLGFIMFSAWYVGAPISMADYPAYASVGAFVAFGSMAVAIPFMLDFFSLPADMFQLYLLGSVMTARFATALAAMHGIVISLLVAFAIMGKLRWRTLLQIVMASIVVAGVAAAGVGYVLTKAIPYHYTGEKEFIAKTLISDPVKVKQVEKMSQFSPVDTAQPRLDVIRNRGSLRVAYLPDALPFAYRNSEGVVVGYDIDLMRTLAFDIGVSLELIRLDWQQARDALKSGQVDIAVGGIAVTPTRAIQVAFSGTYIDHSVGFVVPDHRRDEFVDVGMVNHIKDLHILVGRDRHYVEMAKKLFPHAGFEEIDSPRPYFRGKYPDAVLLFSAEAGSAWTQIYPQFTVVVPKGIKGRAPAALALPPASTSFQTYVNIWLELVEKNGLTEQLYDYWILGKEYKAKIPRWSIMHNVLGWGEAAEGNP